MSEPVTRIRQHPERAVPEEAAEILATAHVAHVGFVVEGQPYVIPFSYHFDPARPDRLYLHGSLTGRALNALAGGAPACATVSLVDGLVASKSAMNHSMNYRSAVCFGRARAVTGAEEKQEIFRGMIARYFEGREPGRDYAPAPEEHLEATAVVELRIDSVTAKARRGGPRGPHDADPAAPGNAGVHPPFISPRRSGP